MINAAPNTQRTRAPRSFRNIHSAALIARSRLAQASISSRGPAGGGCGPGARGATSAVGAVVVIEKFTVVVAAVPSDAGNGLGGLNTHPASLGSPVQVSVTPAGNGAPGVVGVSVIVVAAGVPGGSEPELEIAHGDPMHRAKSVPTPKGIVAVVPPVVVTDTLCVPVLAFAAMENSAVIEVLLATVTPDTVIPVPPAMLTAAPARKFAPVRVTGRFDDPSVAADGLMDVSAGICGGVASCKSQAPRPCVPARRMRAVGCSVSDTTATLGSPFCAGGVAGKAGSQVTPPSA